MLIKLYGILLKGKVFVCEQETYNGKDYLVVAVKLNEVIIGHVPREISRICWFFFSKAWGTTV